MKTFFEWNRLKTSLASPKLREIADRCSEMKEYVKQIKNFCEDGKTPPGTLFLELGSNADSIMRLMADVTGGDEDAMQIMEKKFGRLEDAWNEISKKLGTKNPEPRQIAMLVKPYREFPESMFDMLKKQEGKGAAAEETGMTQTAKSMIGVEPERKKKKKKKEKEFEL